MVGNPRMCLDVEGRLCALFSVILHKRLEYLQSLVSSGSPGTNILQIPRDNCNLLNYFHSFPRVMLLPMTSIITSSGSPLSRDSHPLWQLFGPCWRWNMGEGAHGKLSNYYMFIVHFLPLE